MISFTNRTFFLVAGTAAGHLLTLWFLPHWAAAALTAAAAAAILADLLTTRPALELRRDAPGQIEHQKPSRVSLRALNRSNRTVKLEVEDCAPPGMSPESRRFAGTAPPGGELVFDYEITPSMRGSFDFGRTYVRVTGRLGLARRKSVTHFPDTVRVFPNLDDFRKFQLYIRSSFFHLVGLKPSRIIGRGTVIESLREYRPDDEYSRIDWKSTARMNRPISRNYETEKNQNVILALDTGRLMGAHVNGIPKLDYAIRSALALGMVCASRGDNVGLLAFGRSVENFVQPSRGRSHVVEIMNVIYRLFPSRHETDYDAAFNHLAGRRLRRSLIVVFTDIVDPAASDILVSRLAALRSRHARLCVVLKDSEIEDLAALEPEDDLGVFRKSMAMSLRERRRLAAARLAGKGVGVVEARPEQLSLALIRKYLEMKSSNAF